VLIYIFVFRTVDMVSNLFGYFHQTLGSKRWTGEKKSPETRLIEMYHSHLDPVAQESIPISFCKTKSVLRCIITTLAFGMGIQIPDVEYVIHWGPPADILSYWQEVGRCSRDGRVGKTIIYCPPYSKDPKKVSNDLLGLIKAKFGGCIREGILMALKVKGMEISTIQDMCHGSNCCGFCSNVTQD
jgi:hypothetical protein